LIPALLDIYAINTKGMRVMQHQKVRAFLSQMFLAESIKNQATTKVPPSPTSVLNVSFFSEISKPNKILTIILLYIKSLFAAKISELNKAKPGAARKDTNKPHPLVSGDGTGIAFSNYSTALFTPASD
jgi:hypothetical protein